MKERLQRFVAKHKTLCSVCAGAIGTILTGILSYKAGEKDGYERRDITVKLDTAESNLHAYMNGYTEGYKSGLFEGFEMDIKKEEATNEH